MRLPRFVIFAFVIVLLAVPAFAGVSLSYRPGAWSDVVVTPAGFAHVRATDAAVIVDGGSASWSTAIPEPVLYLRAAADDRGAVEAVGQGNQSGLAYVITATGVRSLGVSFGQNATAIGWQAGRGFSYYVQTSPTDYTVFSGALTVHDAMPATSQGFRDVLADGSIVRGDDAFSAIYNGRRLWEPMTRGGVTVGQCDPAAICAAVDGRTFTVIAGDGFEPHVALSGSTFAVAARTANGAALAIVTPPYPAADPVVAPPPPAPAPTPPVDPVPGQALPDAGRARAIVVQERAKFSAASMRAADIVTLLRNVASRLNAEGFAGGPFGILVKAGGTSCNGYSCDIICSGDGSGQRQWDILGNADPAESPFAGNQAPGWDGPLSPIAVRPCEIQTGAVVSPVPPAPTVPKDDPRVAQLQAALDAANARVAQEVAHVAQLDAAIAEKDQILAAAVADRDQARAALAKELARPAPSCEAKVPASLKALGLRIGCTVKQP